MDETFLHTQHLAIGYRHTLAGDINLTLKSGGVTTLVGANGIGKSTLLRTLSGELSPIKGRVCVMEENLSDISRNRLAKILTIVDTSTGMSGGLQVHEFVELGRQPYTGILGRLSNEDKEVCQQAIKAVGIKHKSSCFMAELSDGERQKAMIARALAQDTPIIFFDEPFSFLDPAARIEIMDMLRNIASEKNKAILLTCHDVALSLRMAARIWLFLRSGELLDFSPDDAIKSGVLERLYDSEQVHFSPEVGDYVIYKQ